MSKEIANTKKTRQFLLDVIKGLSVEHFNEIPTRFNNNII